MNGDRISYFAFLFSVRIKFLFFFDKCPNGAQLPGSPLTIDRSGHGLVRAALALMHIAKS